MKSLVGKLEFPWDYGIEFLKKNCVKREKQMCISLTMVIKEDQIYEIDQK